MSRLRIRIELNRGGVGVPLHKLASVVEEAQKFFCLLTEDVQIDQSKGEWLGFDFGNESLNFTAEFVGPVTAEQVAAFHAAFDGTTSLRRATISQFARITDAIEQDELIGFGLYLSDEGGEPTEWRCLSRRDALRITEEIQMLIAASGEEERESRLPAVAASGAGARVFSDRRERGMEAAKWAAYVREVEANVDRRITRVEQALEGQSGLIEDLHVKSSSTEDSVRKLLTAVEGFCAQTTRQLEAISAPVAALAAPAPAVPQAAPEVPPAFYQAGPVTEPVIVHTPILETMQAPIAEAIQNPLMEAAYSPIAETETIPNPIMEAAHTPLAELVQDPMMETMQAPVEESVQHSFAETMQSPMMETVHAPIAETIHDPVMETMQAPVEESVQHSFAETMQSPMTETVHAPIAETIHDPVMETMQAPVEESVQHSFAETMQSPMTETVHAPIAETIQEPVIETMHATIAETIHSPVMETVQNSVAETMQSPMMETAQTPIAETIQEPVIETMHAPIAETIHSPVMETVQDSVTETMQSPVMEAAHAPIAEAIQEPVMETMHAPIAETVNAPIMEKLENPIAETIHAPAAASNGAPVVEKEKAPITGTVQAPIAETAKEPESPAVKPPLQQPALEPKIPSPLPPRTSPAQTAVKSPVRLVERTWAQKLDWRLAGGAALLVAGAVIMVTWAWQNLFSGPSVQRVAATSSSVPAVTVPAIQSQLPASAAESQPPTPPSQTPPSPAVEKSDTHAPALAGQHLILQASELTWVSAKDAAGTQMLARVFQKGDTTTLDLPNGAIVRVGNAGGLSIVLNGTSIGVIGAHGQVRNVVFQNGSYKVVAAE